MLKVSAVIVICTLAVVINEVGANVNFKDCGSVGGRITAVDINPCTSEPCPFKKNTNVTVQVTFVAEEGIASATTVVHGIIAEVPVPFPLPDKNACHHMTCPIKKGSTVVYKNYVYVKSTYPDVKLVVKWEVLDQNSKDIICFEVPVEIKS